MLLGLVLLISKHPCNTYVWYIRKLLRAGSTIPFVHPRVQLQRDGSDAGQCKTNRAVCYIDQLLETATHRQSHQELCLRKISWSTSSEKRALDSRRAPKAMTHVRSSPKFFEFVSYSIFVYI